MTCSPARLLANQANARRSTGPRTPSGKARSRCNALKHGMTGAGVALPEEDAAAVARRFEGLKAELAPSGPMGGLLVHRVALLSVRLERSAEHEAAALSQTIRHARDDHDEQRYAEVAALLEALADSPATNARRLLRTPEGVDATIQAWLDLKADLGKSNARRWTAAHSERAHHLTGRRVDEIPISRINELSHAIWGDFGLLEDHEGAGLDDKARQSWAKERLLELIDEEVEALRECRETLDLDAFELDREEAGRRALFDPSKEATLARRYEAAAERGLFRALKEFRQVEREAAENPQLASPPAFEPLGSFFPAVEAPPEEDLEPVLEAGGRQHRRSGRVSPPAIRPAFPDGEDLRSPRPPVRAADGPPRDHADGRAARESAG